MQYIDNVFLARIQQQVNRLNKLKDNTGMIPTSEIVAVHESLYEIGATIDTFYNKNQSLFQG